MFCRAYNEMRTARNNGDNKETQIQQDGATFSFARVSLQTALLEARYPRHVMFRQTADR